MEYVQARMSPMDSETRKGLTDIQFNIIRDHDLGVLIQPYVYIGAAVILLLVLIRVTSMPKNGDTHSGKKLSTSLRELYHTANYREGVIAQFFYIGAQVMCWTFIIQYGTHIFMNEGMDERAAEIGDNVKIGGAGLIMSILGGSVFPPLQAFIIDMNWTFMALPATNVSFILVFICFCVVAKYGHSSYIRHNVTHNYVE